MGRYPEKDKGEKGKEHTGQNEDVYIEGRPPFYSQIEGDVWVGLILTTRVEADMVLCSRTDDSPLRAVYVLSSIEIHKIVIEF